MKFLRRHGQVVRQRIANPLSPVRIWVPPLPFPGNPRAGSTVDQVRTTSHSHPFRPRRPMGSAGPARSHPPSGLLPFPDGLSRGVKSRLQISHQSLQSFSPAPGWRKMIGDHSRMAEIQQQGNLLLTPDRILRLSFLHSLPRLFESLLCGATIDISIQFVNIVKH